MTSRLNLDTTSQFPLAIPTRSKAPAARLVLRGRDGLALKQWLIKTTKCTLGSDPECNLRCDLPGIAAYHVLIVVGARQTFLRALAPRLTRDGIAVNELLLTAENSSFEIAGHQFELSRQDADGQLSAPGPPQARMRFALSNPLETRTKSGSETAPKVIADGEHNDLLPAGSDTATPRWVARIVRDAVLPLETQLREVMQPIEALKAEVKREKRRRQAEEEQRRDLENREPAKPEIDAAAVQSVVKEQVEAITARQAGAMDVITERISDVNHQLSSIERIVAAERESQPVELESRVTEEIEAQSQSVQKLQEGFVAVASALSDLQASQRATAETEAEWKQDVQAKLDALQDAVENMRGKSAEVAELSDEERERFTREVEQSQTAFDTAVPTDDDYANVEVAAQTIASEWDPAELTSVVDSDKVDVTPSAVPFAALANPSAVQPQAEPAEQEDAAFDEQPFEAPAAPVPSFTADDVWDQEAEIESIELYGPSDPNAAEPTLEVDEVIAPTPETAAEDSNDVHESADELSSELVQDSTPTWDTGDDDWATSAAASSTADDDVFPTLEQTNARSNEVTDPFADSESETAAETGESDAATFEPQQTQVVADADDWADSPAPVPDVESNGLFGYADDAAAQQDEPPVAPDQSWEQPAESTESASSEPQLDSDTSAESIAEEQASLPSWWDESDDASTGQAAEQASEAASSAAAAGFIDPEFATAAELPRQEEEPEIEPAPEETSDPGSGLAATADSEGLFGGGVPQEPQVDWDAEHAASSESQSGAALSSELTGTAMPAAEPEPVQPEEAQPEIGAGVLAAEQTAADEDLFPTLGEEPDEQPVSTAKDTSTSALELIDELTVATEAANDDSATDVVNEDDEFPTVATAAPLVEEAAAQEEALQDNAIVEDTQTEQEDSADEHASLINDDESFPTVETMAGAEPSSIFSLVDQDNKSDSDSDSVDTQEPNAEPEPSGAFDIIAANEASPEEVAANDIAAHQLDSVQSEPEVERPELAIETPETSAAPETFSDAQEPASSDGEDESVEDYMRRLLARMRGEEDPEADKKPEANNPDLAITAPSKMIQEAQAEAEATQPSKTGEHDSAEQRTEDAFDIPGMPESMNEAASNGLTPEQMRLLEEKEAESRNRASRKPSPEQSGQLEAMRELANSTARTAIGNSTRRRVLSSFALKGTISAIGLAVAVALISINGFALNIGLIATGAAVLVAAIWGWDALTTLRHFKQVPADAPESEEESPTDS